MTTYIEQATLTSGTTKDTFGTAVTINLNSKARRVLALISSGCDTVYTTAEGHNVQLRVTSSSLGLADQRFSVGPYQSSGPATNGSGQGGVPEIIPVDWPAQGNEAMSFDTAPTTTTTTGKSTNLGIMYTDDDLPPEDWRRHFPNPVPARGGYVVDASQLTTTRTALTAINIPSWVTEIIAVKASVLKTGAITGGQSGQAFFEVTSTIPDVTPMKIPTNSEGATLGTPVGTGQYNDFQPWIPVYFKNPGGTQTITPYVNLIAAVSTGNEVVFGVLWR